MRALRDDGIGVRADNAYDNRRGQVVPAPDYVDARVLAASTAEVQAIPASASFVRMNSNVAPFYVRFGAAAAIPAADVADGTASAVNPEGIYSIPTGVTTIGVIAPAITVVTFEFWD